MVNEELNTITNAGKFCLKNNKDLSLKDAFRGIILPINWTQEG